MFAVVSKTKIGSQFVLDKLQFFKTESEAIVELAATNVERKAPQFVNYIRVIREGTVIV